MDTGGNYQLQTASETFAWLACRYRAIRPTYMKIVIASTHLGENFIYQLRNEFPQATFVSAYTAGDQAREARDAQVYFGWPNRRTVETARELQWVACPGMGIDKIVAVEEIVNSTVVVTNAPGAHAAAMADYTIGVMLALAHRFQQSFKEQQAHEWNTARYEGKVAELSGRTLGIYGFGAIGRGIAKRAVGFDMSIYAIDPIAENIPPHIKACWRPNSLDQLCRISDWFVIAAPYTSETKLSIDRRRLALMKKGACVLVVSRGGIVDEDALADALVSGRLAGAALDATDIEPLPKSSRLWDTPNLIITPHVSALSPELYEGRRAIFRENVRRFLSGEDLLHVCDKRAGF